SGRKPDGVCMKNQEVAALTRARATRLIEAIFTVRATMAENPLPMPSMTRVMRPSIPPGASGLRNTVQSEGDSGSALMAEMTMAAEIVTANCRNSTPDEPGRKATGMNTESSTSVMAITGPAICDIALLVASAAVKCG